MDRNIPDVRDIFGRGSNDSAHRKQELRSYEYSPRSRRKCEDKEDYDRKMPSNDYRANLMMSGSKKSNRNRQSVPDEFSENSKHNKKSDDHQKPSKKDAAYYSNRTLTERDIRHLERHLSMKKTIRKQISRNLAQAFVDDPDLVLKDAHQGGKSKVSNDRTFTLTKAKVSKSEQNVLDLLKDNEPDSGHCSADNPNSSDDDSPERMGSQSTKPIEKITGSSRSVAEPIRNKTSNADNSYKDDGKFSFWRMFSVKNKSKR